MKQNTQSMGCSGKTAGEHDSLREEDVFHDAMQALHVIVCPEQHPELPAVHAGEQAQSAPR